MMNNPEEQPAGTRKREREGDDYSRYAITFGEVAILHVGGVEIGTMREQGFSVPELEEARDRIRAEGGECELVMVSDALPEKLRAAHLAATLVIRNGTQLLLKSKSSADELLSEQDGIAYDRKFYNTRQKKTMNKQARYNVVFGEADVTASEDYQQPTVHGLSGLPRLAAVREALPELLGPKAAGLNAEGNHYYQQGSGIGFHGDAERKIVICVSLGSTSTLRYQWR
eukprot:TRINITY_DN2613_c0_g2_i10.p1 TRINITY_DN2613_c0_g2~~TRINITY_DN2613_c0_g2_i10.p1  ORF type:complete len:227 (-),score=44.77 TRINITY_DN2613_c0_g2_i10:424-1104(-)